MHLIVCTDNHMGLGFNGRRQSRDRVLSSYLLKYVDGKPLWMAEYSAGLFDPADNILVSPDFLLNAQDADFCFAEGLDPEIVKDRIQSLILCRWNRDYPADRFMTLDLSAWHLGEVREFSGSSHEKLTIEVYVK